eukprot:1833449-Prymnesium_polylepis.1
MAWGGGVVVVLHAIIGAWLKYSINNWYSGFYDLLQTAAAPQTLSGEYFPFDSSQSIGIEELFNKMRDFAWMVLPMCILNPLVKYLRARWSFAWRMKLMKEYVEKWNPRQRPVEGAAQRVHEDTQRFSSGINGCMVVALDAVCTLVVFIPILLDIGERVVSPHWCRALGRAWLLCLALFSALVGVVVAGLIGHKLIGLE